MSSPSIVARGVEKRFGAVTALREINLEVAPGTTLAVLGPNGAGKSTLLRLLAGLSRPSRGRLLVAGQRADRPASRARVGFMGHATFVYPELTARENLIFAGRIHRVADPAGRADRLLEQEALDSVAHRRAGTFSRGLLQRLAIARTLVHDPAVVLLDEPYTGLDRAAAGRLSDALRGLRTRRRTTVLASHDVAQAASLADRAIVLARGAIVYSAEGPRLALDALERAYVQAATDAS